MRKTLIATLCLLLSAMPAYTMDEAQIATIVQSIMGVVEGGDVSSLNAVISQLGALNATEVEEPDSGAINPKAPVAETTTADKRAKPSPMREANGVLPEGTVISVRTIDPIKRSEEAVGQLFAASIDKEVRMDETVLIPKGANARVELVQLPGEEGKKAVYGLRLDAIEVNGEWIALDASREEIRKKGGAAPDPLMTAIAGAVGAAVGAAIDGKKGAAIGAGIGAGSWAAIEAIRGSKGGKVPAETKVRFTLAEPLAV